MSSPKRHYLNSYFKSGLVRGGVAASSERSCTKSMPILAKFNSRMFSKGLSDQDDNYIVFRPLDSTGQTCSFISAPLNPETFTTMCNQLHHNVLAWHSAW